MKRWNDSSFNRTKLATAVAVVSLGLMAAGCGSDGDRSVSTATSSDTVAGDVVQIRSPIGSVTGHIQDTNGNPVVGATVGLAGQTATTDATGNYLFEEVQVVGVTGADGAVAGGALQVVVQAAGHLGATVTVTPLAQIDGTPSDTAGGGGLMYNNNNTTFVDGFLAAAGTTVLPKIGATLTGHVRLGTTGEPLPSHTVALDFAAVLNSAQVQQQVSNGVTVSYAVPETYYATTDAAGFFTIANLPADSAFNLAVQPPSVVGTMGYTVTAVANPGNTSPNLNGAANANAALVGINNEGIPQYVGTVTVLPVVSFDTRAPVVSAVATVKNPYDVIARVPYTAPVRPAGALNNQTFQDITVVFSEQMNLTALSADSVVVWNSTDGRYEALSGVPVVGGDNKSITISLVSVFDSTAKKALEVNLLIDDFRDAAGNLLVEASSLGAGVIPVANAAAGTGGNLLNDIAYDNVVETASGCCVKYLRLDLCTFLEPNQGAGAVTGTQIKLPTVGGGATSEVVAMQTYSGVFNDVEDTRDLFADGVNIDGTNVAEANTRLDALATELTGGAVNVNTDRSLITFTVPATEVASFYRVTSAAAVGGLPLDVRLATPLRTDTNALATIVDVAAPAGTVIEVLVGPGVVAGVSTFTIQPIDGFGNGAAPFTATLVDNVEPTVIIQSAHGLAGTAGAGVVTPFGDGAEITSPGQAAQLSPAWRVNPGHFTEARSTDTELAQALENASNTALVKTGSANGGDTIAIVYDRTAYDARTGNQPFTSAVAMSESLTSASLAINGATATISGVAVQNDVTQSVWGENGNQQAIPGDLIRFTVNDIEAMAASHGGNLSAVGSTDLAGNVSAASSMATIVDSFPPLVKSAVFDATGITIDFNEAIAPLASQPAGAGIVIRYEAGVAQTIPLSRAGTTCSNTADQSAQLLNNGTRLFFPRCFLNYSVTVGGVITVPPLFNYANAFTTAAANSPLGNYTEAAYGLTQTNNRHTSLVWSTIRDARMNSWAERLPTDAADPNPNFAGCAGNVPAPATCLKWTGLGTNPTAGGGGTGQSPIFAMIDGLGPFVITSANAGFTTTTGTPPVATNQGSFVLSFSHPFYVSQNSTVDQAGNAQARLALSDAANAAEPASTNTTITAADCGAFFTYVASPDVGAVGDADSDFPPTATASSSCSVVFAETGNATSAGGTSSSITVSITKRALIGGVATNSNIAVGDEVRVRATHIFQSSLTKEVGTTTVSPAF